MSRHKIWTDLKIVSEFIPKKTKKLKTVQWANEFDILAKLAVDRAFGSYSELK